MEIQVNVNYEDFTQGIRRSPLLCPFARAMSRVLDGKFVWIRSVKHDDGSFTHPFVVEKQLPPYVILDPESEFGYHLRDNITPEERATRISNIEFEGVMPEYVSSIIRAFDKARPVPADLTFKLELKPYECPAAMSS